MPPSIDFPPLETKRLLLRQLTRDDIEFVFRHFHDPQVSRYLLDEAPVANFAEAQAIIDFYQEPEGKTYNRWGIARKADGQLIGTCGFHKWVKPHFRAEVGYDLSPHAWGHGYMTEAMRAVVRRGFDQMGLNRIEALVYVENEPSMRVVQRLGFSQEGRLRDLFRLNGTFYDHYLFALLRREWEANK